jgi:hypothetical protein
MGMGLGAPQLAEKGPAGILHGLFAAVYVA